MVDPEKAGPKNLKKEDPKTSKEIVKTLIETSINNREPIRPAPDVISALRESLISAGCNLEGLTDPEKERLLGSSQFRAKPELDEEGNPTGNVLVCERTKEGKEGVWVKFTGQISSTEAYDRSAGMLAILGTEKFKDLIIWCYQKAVELGYPGRIGKEEGTEGRGLQQAAAKLIVMALVGNSEDLDFQKAQKSLNMSLWKGFRKTTKNSGKRQELDQRFADFTLDLSTEEGKKKYKETSSFPPSALPDLIDFLATL
jgi:hypothetical protein